MPAIMITVIFVACISPLLVPPINFPLYVDSLDKGCRKAWYLDTFFASNWAQYISIGEEGEWNGYDVCFSLFTN